MIGRFLKSLVVTRRPLEERLIEAESKLGGMIFSASNTCRFWYFEGDWFFEQYTANVGFQVIRYQVLENSIHKLFNGIEYPFYEGEKERLVQAIKKYYSTVSDKIYNVPTDPALAV
jgi:hypothetical protein